MGGAHLTFAVSAGNFVVFAVIFCVAVSATSETHRMFAHAFGLALFFA